MKLRFDSISTFYDGITDEQENALKKSYKLIKEKEATYIIINSLAGIINLPKILNEEVIIKNIEGNMEVEIYDSYRE